MLEVKHLEVNYRGIAAVDNISFSVKPGQLVGVIGPNGAGKSTMLKAILGLIPTHQGLVRYQNASLNKRLKEVAYVPQRSQIDWDYPVTVINVVLMARIRSTGWFRPYSRSSMNIVQNALERVGMWDLRDRQIGELSGGQQQRVFLAQALAQQAELFLFDEPFVGVDQKTEEVIFEVFQELKSAGKILLVVTHDLGEVTRQYDRFLLINKQLIAEGSRNEVITADNIQKAYGDRVILVGRN
jgi:manganese/iron transport system ATP-binding protein